MVTIISNSPEETEAAAAEYAQTVKAGTVIGLSGELGAGKTCWVRGLARGLGVSSRVHSPTFALMNPYEGGRISLIHIDLYRLETVDQILEAGLERYLLAPMGVTVVEWIERWSGFAPQPPTLYRSIKLKVLDEQKRIISGS